MLRKNVDTAWMCMYIWTFWSKTLSFIHVFDPQILFRLKIPQKTIITRFCQITKPKDLRSWQFIVRFWCFLGYARGWFAAIFKVFRFLRYLKRLQIPYFDETNDICIVYGKCFRKWNPIARLITKSITCVLCIWSSVTTIAHL